MSIEFFSPRWGSGNLLWEQFCIKVKNAGYDGIEYAIASTVTAKDLDEVFLLAEKHGLKLIAQHYDTNEPEFTKHVEQFGQWLEKVKSYPFVKINSQTGKDFFSFEQNKELVYETFRFATDTGIQFVHETHRNRFLFAAHVCRNYLEQLPDLKITLDASHWVCVAESFLDDQADAMQLAIEHTQHIHARVGYTEGPQVPDPRMEDWQEALNKHLNWWDKVVELKRNENLPLSITTEFGPFPYMVHVPSTGQPVCNQWEVNVWMMEKLKKRYR
jgi:sugar phosphate isomerase/epimerase